LGLAAPSGAVGFERIKSPFLLEYSSPAYVIDQGEIVTFENTDPFLRHGVASDLTVGGKRAFEAAVIGRGQARLVRGAPFLPHATDPYVFRDPAHPGMTANLFVTSAGAPLPPDVVAPFGKVKIRSGGVGGLMRSGKLRLVIGTSEATDVILKATIGRAVLGRSERTYLTPGRRGFGLTLNSLGPLPSRGPARVRVTLRLSDVAGNPGEVKASRLLASAVPRGKKK
jgi:hypothetical protein